MTPTPAALANRYWPLAVHSAARITLAMPRMSGGTDDVDYTLAELRDLLPHLEAAGQTVAPGAIRRLLDDLAAGRLVWPEPRPPRWVARPPEWCGAWPADPDLPAPHAGADHIPDPAADVAAQE